MECFTPNITRKICLDDKNYLLNDKFYLLDFSEWDANIRDWFALKVKLELTSEHNHVVFFLQNCFTKNRRHPVLRTVTTELSNRLGAKKGTVKYFHSLFPGGIHQAYLIAGLPMQDSCC